MGIAPKRIANGKQKWTAEEEAALHAGVKKYGPGKWRQIQSDKEFGAPLARRSNVDLKDKWRNLQMDATGVRRSSANATTANSGNQKRRRPQKDKPRNSEASSEEEEENPTLVTPLRRQPPRSARRRAYLSDPEHDDEAGRQGQLRDSNTSRACTPRSEGTDGERQWESGSEDEPHSEGVFPNEAEQITGAAVLILYGNRQSAKLEDVVHWIQVALSLEEEDAVDPDCIETILALMVTQGRVVCIDGSYRPTGALQELADEAVKKASDNMGVGTSTDEQPHRNYAEKVLSVMDWVREAEDDLRSRRQEEWIRNNIGEFLKEQREKGNLAPGGEMETRLGMLEEKAANLNFEGEDVPMVEATAPKTEES